MSLRLKHLDAVCLTWDLRLRICRSAFLIRSLIFLVPKWVVRCICWSRPAAKLVGRIILQSPVSHQPSGLWVIGSLWIEVASSLEYSGFSGRIGTPGSGSWKVKTAIGLRAATLTAFCFRHGCLWRPGQSIIACFFGSQRVSNRFRVSCLLLSLSSSRQESFLLINSPMDTGCSKGIPVISINVESFAFSQF